ncbi:J domain-containing protein [Pseudoflavitalea rhizosphaerae]|uniref:J domain-containing protein n=1 Tax=Pseudoflavitalea rhizosphaerae TaxID=1884793 RepID=UPI000F8E47D2|nr:J domain-containing protein [Pseudoflavitalea rhizosphaerae]
MIVKDYYKVLEVTPVASLQEIRKSFRRLAIKYHPDKNDGDHLAAARFIEIQEAWEVLSDPQKREEYNYNRWYTRRTGAGYTEQSLTPEEILASSDKVKNTIASMNFFQVDFHSLSNHIRQLLNETNLNILRQFNRINTNHQIIKNLLQAAAPLPLKEHQPVHISLMQLAGDDEEMKQLLQQALRAKKQRDQWDRYKWLVVILIIAFICWLMVAVSDT